MIVDITNPALLKFIDAKLAAGEFPTPAAVVEHALARLMEDVEALSADDLRAIDEAEQEFARGQYVDFDAHDRAMRNTYPPAPG